MSGTDDRARLVENYRKRFLEHRTFEDKTKARTCYYHQLSILSCDYWPGSGRIIHTGGIMLTLYCGWGEKIVATGGEVLAFRAESSVGKAGTKIYISSCWWLCI